MSAQIQKNIYLKLTFVVHPQPTTVHCVPTVGVFSERYIGPNVLVILNGVSTCMKNGHIHK